MVCLQFNNCVILQRRASHNRALYKSFFLLSLQQTQSVYDDLHWKANFRYSLPGDILDGPLFEKDARIADIWRCNVCGAASELTVPTVGKQQHLDTHRNMIAPQYLHLLLYASCSLALANTHTRRLKSYHTETKQQVVSAAAARFNGSLINNITNFSKVVLQRQLNATLIIFVNNNNNNNIMHVNTISSLRRDPVQSHLGLTHMNIIITSSIFLLSLLKTLQLQKTILFIHTIWPFPLPA